MNKEYQCFNVNLLQEVIVTCEKLICSQMWFMYPMSGESYKILWKSISPLLISFLFYVVYLSNLHIWDLQINFNIRQILPE